MRGHPVGGICQSHGLGADEGHRKVRRPRHVQVGDVDLYGGGGHGSTRGCGASVAGATSTRGCGASEAGATSTRGGGDDSTAASAASAAAAAMR